MIFSFSSCLNNNQLKCIQYPTKYRRCNSPPIHFFPLSYFSLRIFPLFPDAYHTHTRFWRSPLPSFFFSSPLGRRICPFQGELGSVLANCLLACHLASPFSPPMLLKGWLGWMFLSALPLSAVAFAPRRRCVLSPCDVAFFHQAAKNIIPHTTPHQC
ncbi:hypothetical protein K443DRAFT_521043 [Laccaria amethystina LaAM-08-1]|uniref:Uncharacterized protein n=1 Tax=Laccaria amethystina LaAM-08-1 TaxID=1095629 RepID=A0A0C9XC09_9AGAR|nr:hypothetical protein K443DRAFT_521043 [Laccaria amethystina LaAM-08-1]